MLHQVHKWLNCSLLLFRFNGCCRFRYIRFFLGFIFFFIEVLFACFFNLLSLLMILCRRMFFRKVLFVIFFSIELFNKGIIISKKFTKYWLYSFDQKTNYQLLKVIFKIFNLHDEIKQNILNLNDFSLIIFENCLCLFLKISY
jgi:hypothetical protein